MSDTIEITDGIAVYSEDGDELGVVTGTTSDGFVVAVEDGVEYVEEANEADADVADGDDGTDASDTRHRIEPEEHEPGPDFGEGYLMWRCEECGEMGDLDEGLPEECPNCGSEEVIKWKED